MDFKCERLYICTSGVKLKDQIQNSLPKSDITQVCTSTMRALLCRHHHMKKGLIIEVFVMMMGDIQKALASKKHLNPHMKLPGQYAEFLKLFKSENATNLSPH